MSTIEKPASAGERAGTREPRLYFFESGTLK